MDIQTIITTIEQECNECNSCNECRFTRLGYDDESVCCKNVIIETLESFKDK